MAHTNSYVAVRMGTTGSPTFKLSFFVKLRHGVAMMSIPWKSKRNLIPLNGCDDFCETFKCGKEL